jgi:hypothetical protein
MTLTQLPTTIVRITLDGIRLPLLAVERVAGQSENAMWAPTMAFEGFEAGAKQFAGALLRDNALIEEGRIQQAKISELRRAAELEVKADQTRVEADAALRQRQEAAERERVRAEQQARQQEAAAERQKREAQQEADAKARRAEQVVQKVDAQREQQIEATERQARLASVEAESAAIRKERKAVASAEKVATLASAVDAKKSQRKSS